MRNNSGQVLVLLIVIITVALATGLSIIQKSISDVSTASKVEQSSRAFSAAEAGIEKALQDQNPTPGISDIPAFGNNASARITEHGLLPTEASVNNQQSVLEYPPLAKEEVAQVWLADFTSINSRPPEFYNPPANRWLDVYWGNSTTDKAAIELTLVYYEASQYKTRKWYLDQIVRNPANNFEQVTCTGNYSLAGYQCKKTLGNNIGINNSPLPSGLMLLRARLLYNSASQSFAVQAVGTCGHDCSLPAQAREIYSTGTSGETQRRIKVFREEKVVPFYFNYAIFSTGEITK